MGTSATPPQNLKKLDCKHIAKLTANKISFSISILDKLKIELGIDPQKIAVLNSWTSYALMRIRIECEEYKASDGGPDARKRYDDEKDKLDGWVADLARVLAEHGISPDPKATDDGITDKTKDQKDAIKSDVEKTIDKHSKTLAPDVKSTAEHGNKTISQLLFDLQKAGAADASQA